MNFCNGLYMLTYQLLTPSLAGKGGPGRDQFLNFCTRHVVYYLLYSIILLRITLYKVFSIIFQPLVRIGSSCPE